MEKMTDEQVIQLFKEYITTYGDDILVFDSNRENIIYQIDTFFSENNIKDYHCKIRYYVYLLDKHVDIKQVVKHLY